MRILGLFNKFLSHQAISNKALWHHELQTIIKYFPHIAQTSKTRETLKQRYDRIYPIIFKDQQEAFNFLQQGVAEYLEREYHIINSEISAYVDKFNYGSLLKRKAYLTYWNTKLAAIQISNTDDTSEIILVGLSEVTETTVRKLSSIKNLKKISFQNCRFRYLPESFIQLSTGLHFTFDSCGDRLEPPVSIEEKSWSWNWFNPSTNIPTEAVV